MRRKKVVFVDCPECSARVPEAGLQGHIDSVVCRAGRIEREYEARGWERLDGTQTKIVTAAPGVPLELAPAGVHEEEVVVGRETSGSIRKLRTAFVKRVHDVAFAPSNVRHILNCLKNMKLETGFRSRAVAALWDMAPTDLFAQVETIRRLGGSAKSYVWRLVVDAEEAKARAKPPEPAQGEEHGSSEEDTSSR